MVPPEYALATLKREAAGERPMTVSWPSSRLPPSMGPSKVTMSCSLAALHNAAMGLGAPSKGVGRANFVRQPPVCVGRDEAAVDALS